MNIVVEHDKKADTVYLHFSRERVSFSRKLDQERVVDYSEDGEIRGIRFLRASSGVNTNDLPHRSAIERAFHQKGFARSVLGNGAQGTESNRGPAVAVAAPQVKTRVRVSTVARATLALIVFFGCTAASVFLARNLFMLTSLTGFLANILGLVVALLPTVLGCFILLAWVFDVRDTDIHP